MAARDIIVITILLFSFAIGFFVINYMMNTTLDAITSISVINESSGSVTAFEGINTLMGKLDYIILGLLIGFIMTVVISSWFIPSNPLFVFFYFLVTIVIVSVSAILSNVWESITQSGQFGTTLVQFPVSNHLMLHLPVYVGIISFIGIVTMFAKPYFQERYS